MKIGVFDSGIGGKSVAQAIRQALPEHEVLFRADDPAHFPYATKSPEELFGYVVPVVQSLITDGCEVVVIACNTVSTTLIDRLREHFSTPLVAIEPMVKVAAEKSKSGRVIVCATPTTLASARYEYLKQAYASNCIVIEPDCSDWSALIESNNMNRQRLDAELMPALRQGADVIVLGCTHYHWIEKEIAQIAGKDVLVLQPEQAITARLKKVLAQLS